MKKEHAEREGLSRTLDVHAPPLRVYDALTTLEGLRGWWTTLVSGTATVGGEIHFEFEGLDEHVNMRVEAADRPHRVQWECLAHTKLTDWNGTTLDFALSPRSADGCRISFQHVGLTPALECYEDCRAGWNHFLKSLAAYAETGEGAPFGG